MNNLAQALLAFQAEAPALQRDAINPHFGSQYLSLETLLGEIIPALNKCGLVLVQCPTTLDGLPALRTKLVHAKSGECEEDVMLLLSSKPDPQGQGAAITYARRYAAMAMLGLSADKDDDGNAASKTPARRASNRGQAIRSVAISVITRDQREQIAAAARERGMSAARAVAIMEQTANVKRSQDIPTEKFEAVLAAIYKYAEAA